MEHSRKAFHFDLDEEKLKAHYPSDSATGYKRAWSNIRSFLESNGFEHAQYSGYESVGGMSYYEAYSVLENLQEKFPWFVECAQVATVTEIGRRHDVLEHLSKMKEVEEPEPESRFSPSLHEELSEMKRASQALENEAALEPPHRDDHNASR